MVAGPRNPNDDKSCPVMRDADVPKNLKNGAGVKIAPHLHAKLAKANRKRRGLTTNSAEAPEETPDDLPAPTTAADSLCAYQ